MAHEVGAHSAGGAFRVCSRASNPKHFRCALLPLLLHQDRGKDYNHSTFLDIIIAGLIGLRATLASRIHNPRSNWQSAGGKQLFPMWVAFLIPLASPHPRHPNVRARARRSKQTPAGTPFTKVERRLGRPRCSSSARWRMTRSGTLRSTTCTTTSTTSASCGTPRAPSTPRRRARASAFMSTAGSPTSRPAWRASRSRSPEFRRVLGREIAHE